MGSFLSKHMSKSRFNTKAPNDSDMKDMPLTKTMTGSGGPHAHKEGHKGRVLPDREPARKGKILGVSVKSRDNYGGGNSGNYDLLNAPKDAYNAVKKAYKSVTGSKTKKKVNKKGQKMSG
tara:strand:+ start:5210 stop:5569 length:360 start_codon:yes stop_codon:yes gene_type:complete